jgi:hypothetical protein
MPHTHCGEQIMKTLTFLLILLAVPAIAQESPADGSIFDALKQGDWVTYSTSASDLLDLSVVEKPADTTIARYWEDMEKARSTESAARTKYNQAVNELRFQDLTAEERQAKESALEAELNQALESVPPALRRTRQATSGRRGASRSGLQPDARPAPRASFTVVSPRPYEVTSIRKEYLVVSNGTEEQFIARNAVRMVRRKVQDK